MSRLLFHSPQKRTSEPFVSVIVAARNASNIVLNCLDALLLQDYPQSKYEIICVDDQSADYTLELLIKFSENRSFLVLQNSGRGKYKSSKKEALELAVSNARGEILLFTDADCLPPETWVRTMVAHFDSSVGLVAGFSPQRASHKFMNSLLKIDAASAAIVSAGTIGWGRGVTCTGRNLAYRKQALDDIDGFAGLPDSLSGDDDFVLQAISKHPKWNIKYAFDPESVVPANGPENIKEFLRQKQRHISAGKYFSITAKIGFAFFHLLNMLLWIAAILAIFVHPFFLVPFTLKLCVDYFSLRFFLARFKMTLELSGFLSWEMLFVYYNTITGPIGFLKKIKW